MGLGDKLVQSWSNRIIQAGSAKVAQGFIHSGLENLQGWRLHNLSVQPISVFNCPQDEKQKKIN